MVPRSLMILLLLLTLVKTSAQELVTGAGIAVGRSWELSLIGPETTTTIQAGVEGGNGVALSGLLGCRIDQVLIAFHPELLLQQTMAYRRVNDATAADFRRKVYPAALLLPLIGSLYFGEQRFRPVLNVGAGFLVALKDNFPATGVRPEPFLPYLDVGVGLDFELRGMRIRPEFSVRNGTGEMFRNITNQVDSGLARQRWAYASFGLVLTN